MKAKKSQDTSIKSKESRCSCDRCDSAFCFTIRNAQITCSCDPCPVETGTIGSKESSIHRNMPNNSVMLRNFNEAVLKDILLDRYDEIATEQISRQQSQASNKKVGMENKTSLLSVGRFIDRNSYDNYLDNNPPRNMNTLVNPLSTHLAAQIMNLPSTDSNERTYNKTLFKNIIYKYSNDIFKRIRDVYKACSCKVCQCIASKSMINKMSCNCKPCVCNKCKPTVAIMLASDLFPVDDKGCTCARCDRKECKIVTSDKTKSVKPRVFDYNRPKRQNKYGFHEPCDCKPCQCIECQVSSRVVRNTNLIVAPVEQNFPACDCSSCSCSQCVQYYRVAPTATVTTHREMSTGINRHLRCQCEACVTEACIPDDNDSCWCVRHKKIISKPLQKDGDEYDIHRTKLSCEFHQTNLKKGHAVAMFAEVDSKFPNITTNPKKCDCGLCECTICNRKENRESMNVPERDCETNCNNHCLNGESSSNCKKNCEYDKGASMVNRMNTSYSKSGHSFKNNISNECQMRKHDSQQLSDNTNQDINSLHMIVHSPASSYQNTVNSFAKRHGNSSYSVNTILNNSVVNPTTAKSHGVHVYENAQQCIDGRNIQIADIERVSKVHNISNIDEIRPFDTVTEDYASYTKDSGSISPISRNKKTGESSLNSSGHDYANYLIHFPKTNVKECINDIMKTDLTSFKSDVNNNNHILTTNNNDMSVVHGSNSLSFTSKLVAESISSRKAFSIEGVSKGNVWHTGETLKNTTQKKDSRQELINAQNDYYRQTKRAIITPSTENYRKVQNTLKEAREFSQELVKLLQKYENANKHFDNNGSKKIKMSNLSINRKELLKGFNYAPIYGSHKDSKLNSKIVPSMVRDVNNNKVTEDTSRGTKPISNTQPNSIGNREQSQNVPTENINNQVKKMHLNRKEASMFNYKVNASDVANENNQTDEENFSRTSHDKAKDVISCNTESTEKQLHKNKRCKGYKSMYKRTITASKKMESFTKCSHVNYDGRVVTEQSETNQDQTTINNEVVNISKSIIAINESKNVVTAPNPTSYKSSETNYEAPQKASPKILMIKSSEHENITESSINEPTVVNKHIYCEAELNARAKQTVVVTLPALEMEIKDAIKMFSIKCKEMSSSLAAPILVQNEESVIQSEAKQLLDSKVFEAFIEKTKNTSDTKGDINIKESISTTNHSEKEREKKVAFHNCLHQKQKQGDKLEDLRVNYVCIRKVSEHTVFVKWNPPQNLEKVRGYEVLIDGRIIHKIHNVTKCMAVVTCLSATQKTLLTVRTVPNVPHAQSMLATTVVYRPRSKK